MTCFFWQPSCVIDYPSWFQAVGSVLAIFAAVGIAYWQHHKTEANSNASKELKRNAQLQVGYYFALQVSNILKKCMQADHKKNPQILNLQHPKLDDLLTWSRIFVIDTYNKDEMHGFLQIRDSAFELKSWIERAQYFTNIKNENSKIIYLGITPCLELFNVELIDFSQLDQDIKST